jgi:hypothetical protein
VFAIVFLRIARIRYSRYAKEAAARKRHAAGEASTA